MVTRSIISNDSRSIVDIYVDITFKKWAVTVNPLQDKRCQLKKARDRETLHWQWLSSISYYDVCSTRTQRVVARPYRVLYTGCPTGIDFRFFFSYNMMCRRSFSKLKPIKTDHLRPAMNQTKPNRFPLCQSTAVTVLNAHCRYCKSQKYKVV